MRTSPAMASIPYDGDVLKAPKIHMAALLCIFLKLSDDISWEHGYKTKAETYIMQCGEYKFYTEGTSEGG